MLNGQIGQDLAIEFDSRQFKAMHEFAVGQPIGPCSGIYTDDPQCAEITLSLLAARKRILPGSLHSLAGSAIEAMAGATKTLCQIKKFFMPPMCGNSSLHTHLRILPSPVSRRRYARRADLVSHKATIIAPQ